MSVDDGMQNIPVSSILNLDAYLAALRDMSDDEARARLEATLETLSFEDQAEFWRLIGETQAGES
jgi:hypothetical protein